MLVISYYRAAFTSPGFIDEFLQKVRLPIIHHETNLGTSIQEHSDHHDLSNNLCDDEGLEDTTPKPQTPQLVNDNSKTDIGFQGESSFRKMPASGNPGPHLEYCQTCENFKYWHSHHCVICRRCVIRMDHHCRILP